ncbi:MAG: DUF1743 domain-containing protein, partial [Euryarchaeota archaeon]|nr:DUF1743 domain-containing protein [Euryarchaeota archaeon]
MEIVLGLDDTDSLRGGCTTHLAWRLQAALAGLARPADAPLLLRLNPTIPYRTRGNGAVALRLETGDPRGVLEAAVQMVEEQAWMEDPRTHPGLVLLPRPPTPAQRETAGRAITGVVELEEARRAINGAPHRGWKKERGLVGALAAASYAWTGLPDPTYELLAYRHPEKWGTPRDIDPQSVQEADRATYPETWHTLDRADGRILFAPHTPCPILCGVRG